MTASREEEVGSCDLCGEPLPERARYRRAQFVVDAADSIVGESAEFVEHAYSFVFCAECASQAIDFLVPAPTESVPEETETSLVDRAVYEAKVLEIPGVKP